MEGQAYPIPRLDGEEFKQFERETAAPEIGQVVRVLYCGRPLSYGGTHLDRTAGRVVKVTPTYVWVHCTHGSPIKVPRGEHPIMASGYTFDLTSK